MIFAHYLFIRENEQNISGSANEVGGGRERWWGWGRWDAADRQALMIRATQGKMCLEQRGNWQLYITVLYVFMQLFGTYIKTNPFGSRVSGVCGHVRQARQVRAENEPVMTETLAITVTLVRQIKVTSSDTPEAASPWSAADHDPPSCQPPTESQNVVGFCKQPASFT